MTESLTGPSANQLELVRVTLRAAEVASALGCNDLSKELVQRANRQIGALDADAASAKQPSA